MQALAFATQAAIIRQLSSNTNTPKCASKTRGTCSSDPHHTNAYPHTDLQCDQQGQLQLGVSDKRHQHLVIRLDLLHNTLLDLHLILACHVDALHDTDPDHADNVRIRDVLQERPQCNARVQRCWKLVLK